MYYLCGCQWFGIQPKPLEPTYKRPVVILLDKQVLLHRIQRKDRTFIKEEVPLRPQVLTLMFGYKF